MPFLTPGTAPTAKRCRRLNIPDSVEWLELVNGALVVMINEWNWEQIDGITPTEAAQAAQDMFLAYQTSDEDCSEFPVRIIGQIFPYASSTVPAGCLPCEGGTYNQVDYPDLYMSLDAAYILSMTQFQTPDMRGRATIGAGTGSGLTARAVGATGGAETHTLNVGQMPNHNHSLGAHTHTVTDPGHIHTLTDPGHTHALTDPGHTHTIPGRSSTADGTGVPRLANSAVSTTTNPTSAATTGISANSAATGASVDSHTTGISLANATPTIGGTGFDIAHNNMQPFIALKYAIVAEL